MDEVESGLLILWEHSGAALWTPLLWGVGVGLVTLVGVVGLWLLARRRGWLEVPSAAAWPRQATLVCWILLLTPTSGAAGVVYGAERATLDVLAETQVVERSCGVIAAGVVLAATEGEVVGRIPVARLRGLWIRAGAEIDVTRDRAIQVAVESQLPKGAAADAATVIARWGAAALQRELVGGTTETLEGLMIALEGKAAADGTVGVDEAGVLIRERVVAPKVHALVVDLFRPYYRTLWILVALGIVSPFAAAGWSRRAAAKRRAAPLG
ncbi:MAG: hypothetical protein R3B09_20390 [Nannocystaceae bacterium]